MREVFNIKTDTLHWSLLQVTRRRRKVMIDDEVTYVEFGVMSFVLLLKSVGEMILRIRFF